MLTGVNANANSGDSVSLSVLLYQYDAGKKKCAYVKPVVESGQTNICSVGFLLRMV
jgi:nitrate reductase beta subunit